MVRFNKLNEKRMEDDARPHYTFANSKQSERHLEYSRSLAKLLHFRIYKIVSLSAAASRKRLNTFFAVKRMIMCSSCSLWSFYLVDNHASNKSVTSGSIPSLSHSSIAVFYVNSDCPVVCASACKASKQSLSSAINYRRSEKKSTYTHH